MVTRESFWERQTKGSDTSTSTPSPKVKKASKTSITTSFPKISPAVSTSKDTKVITLVEEESETMDYANSTGQNNNSSGQNPTNIDHPAHTAHQIALSSASTNATLMQVYASLTQSSTPQVAPASTDASVQPTSKYHIPPPMFHVPTTRGSGDGTERRSHQSNVNQQPNGATSQMQYHFKDEVVPPAVSIPSSIRMESGDGHEQTAANEESDEQSSFHSSRRKRRGSQDSGVRGGNSSNGSVTKPKKKSKQDGRWSKRFTWPEDLHRDFVSAIFDVGLKQSSPSTILEHMPKHEQITTERIKSHLQKYRLHRAKSKKEFISSYEASLRKFQNQGGPSSASNIAGGEVAAHLTYSNTENTGDNRNGAGGPVEAMSPGSAPGVMSENVNSQGGAVSEDVPVNSTSAPLNQPLQEQNESLMLPELTELEKQSPIGAAMGYLMGLFFSLRQQLLIQRSLEGSHEGARSDAPVHDVYNSFAGVTTAPVAAVTIASDYPSEGMLHQQSIPSMRTNIEENSIMKREMQNQMVLQNKMRALKEQELAKYKNSETNSPQDSSRKSASAYHYGGDNDQYSSKNQDGLVGSDPGVSHGQGTGELAGHDNSEMTHHRPHGLSFGNSADMWNADVVDEQLFEFLMND
ncbi:Myb-like DNA-binding protein [Nitzschia inconspicua]|uniref:Myb-like DNA-binding protein n=1 Tax=Nitzschia inconspicua TaxID=303405 RepID=A0A9K3PVH7_9STRA|nr:Myb-like DNA-binding protein [Nitzschia inconspicua]